MNRMYISMIALCALSLAACSAAADRDGRMADFDSDEELSESSGDGEGSDDRPSAPPDAPESTPGPNDAVGENGQHITEAAACETLVDAQEARAIELGCLMTMRICPTFLRVMTGEACVEYDEGSVQLCIERYNAASSCDNLAEAIDECTVNFYPDTQSADCD